MDDDKIVQFPGVGAQEFPAPRNDLICSSEEVFAGAINGNVTQLVLVGLDDRGELYLASNIRQMSDALMLVKRAEMMIVRTEHGEC